jgi:hypothetical protein
MAPSCISSYICSCQYQIVESWNAYGRVVFAAETRELVARELAPTASGAGCKCA